ncbi:hypothetical protein [Acinetobacter bereziniae]|uniref:hypothetical protein n=1 Tax=Acinetobacter bereziniae TaxID=106648 RepID=UPI001D0EC7C1|nr:hypothetical protein [Acinetobacter bereziniae]
MEKIKSNFEIIEETLKKMREFIHHIFSITTALILNMYSISLYAEEIYDNNGLKLNLNLEAISAAMHSQENYNVMGNKQIGNSSWQEGYAKYGFTLDQKLKSDSHLYGTFDLISSATWGDGDAAGITRGSERKTNIENASIGWKSGNLIPILGQNGLGLSVGKQSIRIGEGFLLLGDMFNYGNADVGVDISRGGAYYLAARKSFAQTAKISLGGEEGIRSDLMWLKSDNKAQAKTELAAMTLENVSDQNVFGLTWIRGLNQDQLLTKTLGLKDRRNMDTVSLRFVNNVATDYLLLSGEYAYQDSIQNKEESAWYLQTNFKLDKVLGSPNLIYRYSQFSEQYDPLFYGSNGTYGTWFQGEVAANYGGPFSTNLRVHYLGASIFPLEGLELGISYFNFNSINKSTYDYSGREIDIFTKWMIKEHYFISPLIGFFKPKNNVSEGGLQLGNSNLNVYSQIIVGIFF